MATDKTLHQLSRIRGQLDGITSMYQEKQDCVAIVRQILAARNSLGRVARDMLVSEATQCSRESRVEDLDEIIKELFKY